MFENSWFKVFLNNLRAITECLQINYSRDEFPNRVRCYVEIVVLRLISLTLFSLYSIHYPHSRNIGSLLFAKDKSHVTIKSSHGKMLQNARERSQVTGRPCCRVRTLPYQSYTPFMLMHAYKGGLQLSPALVTLYN